MKKPKQSVFIDPLTLEDVEMAIERLITNQEGKPEEFVLETRTAEFSQHFLHTIIKGRFYRNTTGYGSHIDIYETVYVVDKHQGNIIENEFFIKKLLPEHDGDDLQVYGHVH